MFFFFFFNDTATTEIYTLSLHDALPIFGWPGLRGGPHRATARERVTHRLAATRDRKSTRLNSSHQIISYAVFCLKKKKDKCREAQKNGSITIGSVLTHMCYSRRLSQRRP